MSGEAQLPHVYLWTLVATLHARKTVLTAYAEPKERGSFDPNGHSTKNTRGISWYF